VVLLPLAVTASLVAAGNIVAILWAARDALRTLIGIVRYYGREGPARQGGVVFGQAVWVEPAGRLDHLVQAGPLGAVPQ
jgi:hypothetical protein